VARRAGGDGAASWRARHVATWSADEEPEASDDAEVDGQRLAQRGEHHPDRGPSSPRGRRIQETAGRFQEVPTPGRATLSVRGRLPQLVSETAGDPGPASRVMRGRRGACDVTRNRICCDRIGSVATWSQVVLPACALVRRS
jgi:hypothetical protein